MLANLSLGIAVFAADASVLSALNGALAIGVFAATGLVFVAHARHARSFRRRAPGARELGANRDVVRAGRGRAGAAVSLDTLSWA